MESGFDEAGWRSLGSRKAESRTVPEIFSFHLKQTVTSNFYVFSNLGWRSLDSRKAEVRSVPEILSFQSKAHRHIAFLCSFPI